MANSNIPEFIAITTEDEPEVRFIVPFNTLKLLPKRLTEEDLNHKGELIVTNEIFGYILKTASEAYLSED